MVRLWEFGRSGKDLSRHVVVKDESLDLEDSHSQTCCQESSRIVGVPLARAWVAPSYVL